MDTPTFRAALKGLSIPSNSAGLLHLAGHLCILAITSICVLSAPVWWIALPAMVAQGIVLVFLFAPLHECVHYTAFANRNLNKTVAALAGFFLLLPSRWFRYYHLAHHRYTQDPAMDPELQSRPIDSRYRHLRNLSGLPYWRAQILLIWRQAAGRVDDPFVPAHEHESIVLHARISLAVYGLIAILSVATGSWIAAKLWLVPVLLGEPFLRAFLMAEHGNCPLVSDMFRNTRTTFTNRLTRFLAWNMPFHAEHHAFPAVPFHKLPAAHDVMAEQLKVTENGYVKVQRKLYARYRS